MTPQPLNIHQALWQFLDTADTPMHVGILATFSLPKSASNEFVSKIVQDLKAADSIAFPWNQCIESNSLSWPTFNTAKSVDLERHVRHVSLAQPGGERELGIVVSNIHGTPLQANSPLWECHVLEGLAGSRFALYIKVHRSILNDTTALNSLLTSLHDNARSRKLTPFWTRQQPFPEVDNATSTQMEQLLDIVRDSGKKLFNSIGYIKQVIAILSPGNTPLSTLNRPINSERRFATQQLDRARIEKLAAATGSTLNEILVYLCGSSLRRFFKEYNALPDKSLVALVPLGGGDLRRNTAPSAITAGIRIDLGTHVGDPDYRLAAVKKSIAQATKELRSIPSELADSSALIRVAPLLLSQIGPIGMVVKPAFNLTIINNSAGEQTRYLRGSKLEAIYPTSSLLQQSALGINCVDYAGTLNIGFTGAKETLPHLQRLAVYLGNAVKDLEEHLALTGVGA